MLIPTALFGFCVVRRASRFFLVRNWLFRICWSLIVRDMALISVRF